MAVTDGETRAEPVQEDGCEAQTRRSVAEGSFLRGGCKASGDTARAEHTNTLLAKRWHTGSLLAC